MPSTREQLESILTDYGCLEWAHGGEREEMAPYLTKMLDEIEKVYAQERAEAIAGAAEHVLEGTLRVMGENTITKLPWSQGDRGAQHTVHGDKPNRWDDMGTDISDS